MRLPHRIPALALLASALAFSVAACASEAPPGWTFAPPSPTTGSSPTGAPSGEPTAQPTAATSGSPSASASPEEPSVTVTAERTAYLETTLTAPADTPFQIVFENRDAGIPHNVSIHRDTPTGEQVFMGEIFNGVETRTYDVPALPAGTYGYVCTVHANMVGTLTVE